MAARLAGRQPLLTFVTIGVAYDLPLATLNIKDFADFAEHDGLDLVAR